MINLSYTDFFMRAIEQSNHKLTDDIHAWLIKRLKARWFPRDLDTAVSYLEAVLDNSPFFLYGAGSHTHALLEKMSQSQLITQLKGILDRNPQKDQTIAGFPVLPATHALEDTSGQIVLSHHEFEDSMRDDLVSLGVAPERIVSIYLDDSYGELALANLLPGLREQVAAVPALPDKKRIVFINARSRRIIDDKIASLIRSTDRYQLIHIRMERHDIEAKNSPFLDVFNSYNSICLGLYLVNLLSPDLIYVQEHYSSGNFLPLTFGLAFPKGNVVGEFYDFLGLTFDDPLILSRESYWRELDVKLAVEAERWCSKNLKGIVTKESGPVLDDYLSGSHVLELRPHLSRKKFVAKSVQPYQPARLVWAGAINSSHASPRMFGDSQFIDIFQQLTFLGFQVTAYTSINDDKILDSHYADYLDLAECSSFNIKLAVPREELIGVLADGFDFGLQVGIPKEDTQQSISHKVTVSGKLFTYIAAGLPIIVGSYYGIMADWVRDYGLGIVVDCNDLETLPRLINESDYGKLVNNIAEYRKNHNLENSIPELVRFLDVASG